MEYQLSINEILGASYYIVNLLCALFWLRANRGDGEAAFFTIGAGLWGLLPILGALGAFFWCFDKLLERFPRLKIQPF
jgi:hypothetical protein